MLDHPPLSIHHVRGVTSGTARTKLETEIRKRDSKNDLLADATSSLIQGGGG